MRQAEFNFWAARRQYAAVITFFEMLGKAMRILYIVIKQSYNKDYVALQIAYLLGTIIIMTICTRERIGYNSDEKNLRIAVVASCLLNSLRM